MDIKSIIKNEIVSYESSLCLNVNDKMLKTMVFVDNINLNMNEPIFAVMDIPVLNSCEYITLNERRNEDEMFNILNLLGEETVYVVWGDKNVDSLKNVISDYGYTMGDNTIVFDIKKESEKFFGYGEISSIDIIKDVLIDCDIISSEDELKINENNINQNLMHKLMKVMLVEGYNNGILENSIDSLLLEKKRLFDSNLNAVKLFKKEKSTLTLSKKELSLMNDFSKQMLDYHMVMEGVYLKSANDESLNTSLRVLAQDKARISRYKINLYKFTMNSIKANESSDLENINIYYKAIEMYSLIDDCAVMSKHVKESDILYSFIHELGSVFINLSGAKAYSYMLHRGIVTEYVK